MSDTAGNLIYYCNGVKIFNAQHEVMENGDSINWGQFTSNSFNNVSFLILSLPAPESDSLYYIIHIKYEGASIGKRDLLYTKIDMTKNGGLGKVIAKDQFIGTSSRMLSVNACRHANGRDWWILAEEDTANIYYRCLLTPEGIMGFDTQRIGYQPPWPEFPDFGGENLFSPDGSIYVDLDGTNGLRIFDFDRCTGRLSNARLFTFSPTLPGGWDAAISPNSRYLYLCNHFLVSQFDLQAPDIGASIDTVALYDGFDPGPPQGPVDFRYMQLMRDDKIYISPGDISHYIHYIAQPDEGGDACNVVLRGIEVPSFYDGPNIPIFPNYRLYDLPGSPCDTLGIDGPVTAVEEEEEVPTETKLAFKVYPNPSQGNLTIEGPQMPHGETWNIAFYNALGREVQFVPYQSTGITQISLSGLPPGIYWCRVMAGSRLGFIQKITLLH